MTLNDKSTGQNVWLMQINVYIHLPIKIACQLKFTSKLKALRMENLENYTRAFNSSFCLKILMTGIFHEKFLLKTG